MDLFSFDMKRKYTCSPLFPIRTAKSGVGFTPRELHGRSECRFLRALGVCRRKNLSVWRVALIRRRVGLPPHCVVLLGRIKGEVFQFLKRLALPLREEGYTKKMSGTIFVLASDVSRLITYKIFAKYSAAL